MDFEYLNEDERAEAIRATVRNAEQQAFAAEIGVAAETVAKPQADVLAKQAKALAAEAKKRGVEGPYMRDEERREIHKAAMAQIERQALEAELHQSAGITGDAESVQAKRERIAGLA